MHTMLAAILTCLFASGAPAEDRPAQTTSQKTPTFLSSGLKATVVTAAAQKDTGTLSLLLENTTQNDILVAAIGPAVGVNSGNTMVSNSISGIAACDGNARDWHNRVINCLENEKPYLPLNEFTSIEHGNTIPFNITLAVPWHAVDKEMPVAFSLSVALMPESPASTVDQGDPLRVSHAAKHQAGLPDGMKFITVGFPSIDISQ
jgi:hypothetical protein